MLFFGCNFFLLCKGKQMDGKQQDLYIDLQLIFCHRRRFCLFDHLAQQLPVCLRQVKCLNFLVHLIGQQAGRRLLRFRQPGQAQGQRQTQQQNNGCQHTQQHPQHRHRCTLPFLLYSMPACPPGRSVCSAAAWAAFRCSSSQSSAENVRWSHRKSVCRVSPACPSPAPAPLPPMR